jgi:hypothetical protein
VQETGSVSEKIDALADAIIALASAIDKVEEKLKSTGRLFRMRAADANGSEDLSAG